MLKKISLFLFRCNALLLLTGCYKNHLYVQQEWVDKNFLASSHVQTPDPRQKDPPEGQRLLIAWSFSSAMLSEGLSLQVTVRFWDQSEREFSIPILYRKGSHALPFLEKGTPKILTYRVRVLDRKGEEVERWEHQFWTEKIEVSQE